MKRQRNGMERKFGCRHFGLRFGWLTFTVWFTVYNLGLHLKSILWAFFSLSLLADYFKSVQSLHSGFIVYSEILFTIGFTLKESILWASFDVVADYFPSSLQFIFEFTVEFYSLECGFMFRIGFTHKKIHLVHLFFYLRILRQVQFTVQISVYSWIS